MALPPPPAAARRRPPPPAAAAGATADATAIGAAVALADDVNRVVDQTRP
jgi:hypothetical protein